MADFQNLVKTFRVLHYINAINFTEIIQLSHNNLTSYVNKPIYKWIKNVLWLKNLCQNKLSAANLQPLTNDQKDATEWQYNKNWIKQNKNCNFALLFCIFHTFRCVYSFVASLWSLVKGCRLEAEGLFEHIFERFNSF